MQGPHSLGFIGTCVMGEPMCRNLAAHSGHPVLAWDPSPAPLERLRVQGVAVAASAAEVAASAATIFLCLPGGSQLGSLCENDLLPAARAAGYGGAYYPVIAKIVDRG
ncbi:MAG: NAD(P)-binding domain-containing protein [Proteobacteria bacterium]|nr:NAD(P)-binding domain-containing protein [Pseudomonadota bacterium]